MLIISGYTRSVFQDSESYLRTEIDLVEDDIRLVSDEYNSGFITYEISPGIYTTKYVSDILLKFLQSEYEGYHKAVDIEFDDITRKIKIACKSRHYSHKS